jgi:hypothetical protein
MTDVVAHEVMTLGTASPRLWVDWSPRPSGYLTVDGVPAYQIGYSCGTCGLALRRAPTTASAVALGLLDIAPWFRRERHAGLFHFLLDGHHKIAAAAAAARPLSLPSFISSTDSCAMEGTAKGRAHPYGIRSGNQRGWEGSGGLVEVEETSRSVFRRMAAGDMDVAMTWGAAESVPGRTSRCRAHVAGRRCHRGRAWRERRWEQL